MRDSSFSFFLSFGDCYHDHYVLCRLALHARTVVFMSKSRESREVQDLGVPPALATTLLEYGL